VAAPAGPSWRGARRLNDTLAGALGLALLWVGWLPVFCSGPAIAEDPSAAWRTWSAWAAAAKAEHVLAGLVTDGHGAAREISRSAEGVPQLPAADLVLLGEVHDNGHHHLLRSWLLRAIAAEGPLPALVFEHIRSDQQADLDRLRAASSPSADDLFAALDWGQSGWPDSRLFRPLFAAALELRLPILAGNAPMTAIRSFARGGVAALDASERDRLGLAAELDPPLQAALIDELEGSHCGLIPKEAMGGLAAAQRFRDAHLAAAMVEARRTHGRSVLLAGNGHVRSDRGVPWHLRRLSPGAKMLAVMLVEADPHRPEPASYAVLGPDGASAADVMIFTPAVDREDPCEAMRRASRK
jgi:uncharacterized iron-regulated protein